MRVFYMLYSRHKKKDKVISIDLALSDVFTVVGEVRPSAIIINKNKMSLNSISNVIGNDIYC